VRSWKCTSVGHRGFIVAKTNASQTAPLLNPARENMITCAHKKGCEVPLYSTLPNIKLDDWIRGNIQVHLPDKEGVTKIRIISDYSKVVERRQSDLAEHFMSMPELVTEVQRIMPNCSYTFSENQRAGNVGTNPKRKSGPHYCFGFRNSQLTMLPDCTLVLCCVDYGLDTHLVRTLTLNDYECIANGPEVKKFVDAANSINADLTCRPCIWSQNTPQIILVRLYEADRSARATTRPYRRLLMRKLREG